jgi:phenylacetate-CoA ligase
MPPENHYERKLAASWDRARGSEFYRDIGEYSRCRFDQLNLTSKDVLKASPWAFTTCRLGEAAKYYETTGTMGRPTPTPRQLDDIIWNTVSVAEAWRTLLAPEERVAIVLPSDLVPVADLVVGVAEYLELVHARAYPFATGVCDWDRLFEMWDTLNPTAVVIAPGVAQQLTRLAKRRGILDQLADSVHTLLLLGEVNTAAFRTRLGHWWGARALDASYGSTESGTLAAACPHGRQHLLPAANYFELAHEDGVGEISKGGTGRLIVTPLNHHARPLLRFDTGDDVTVAPGCACGSETLTIQVHGRSSDGFRIGEAVLRPRDIEEIVYGVTEATGYLIETDSAEASASLLLERDIDADRSREDELVRQVREHSAYTLGVRWAGVRFVNSLPATTKSGASQKNWKRSNVRVVEAAR